MLPEFDLLVPSTVQEACRMKKETGAKVLAGGTDLFVEMHNGSYRPERLIDLKQLGELDGMEVRDGHLVIGALTRHRALEVSPMIRERFTALFEGCSQVGSVQIRCRGTVGGNICNAVPSADSIGPLLVFDSSCVVSGLAGERTVPLCDFFRGPKRTALEEDEILKSVLVPLPEERSGSAYIKYTRRNAMDLALFGVSCYLSLDGEDRIRNIRIALTTAAPTPMRAFGAEGKLIGRFPDEALAREAGELVAAEARPRSSWRSSAEFRIRLARELTGRTLLLAARRAKEGLE